MQFYIYSHPTTDYWNRENPFHSQVFIDNIEKKVNHLTNIYVLQIINY
jgi:hypothetical protein